MIMKANKQIGFIYKNNESIDKILKDGDVVFERGFLREKTSTTLPITFGGVGKDLKDYKVYGKTYQNSTSGKNLFDKVNATYKNGYLKNDNGNEQTTAESGYLTSYIKVEPNKTYTIQGTLKLPTQTGMYRLYFYDIDKNWISRTNGITQIPPYTFTTPNNCYYMQFQYRLDAYNENTIQIEEGSTATSYEPYTGGQPSPNPDYPQEIISCGDRTRNLFDLSKVSRYTSVSGVQVSVENDNIKINGTNQSSSAVGVYLNDIGITYSLKANKTYVAKYITGQSASASTYRLDIRNALNTSQILSYETGENGLSYTPTEDINIRFYVRIPANGTVDLSGKIMFEESDVLHDYEPYGYKIPVNVRSDNFYNKNDELTSKYINDAGSEITGASGDLFIKTIIDNNIAQKYTINFSNRIGTAYIRISFFNDNTFINRILITESNQIINVPTNATKIDIRTDETTTKYFENLQIVESSTVPSKYIPYYNQTTNIYLDEPLRKIGEYSDYIDFKNGKVIRNIEEIVLDGSENGWYISGKAAKIKLPDAGLTNISELYNYSGSLGNLAYCDYFKQEIPQTLYTAGSSRVDVGFGIAVNPSTSAGLFFANNISALNDFKEWLSSNNTTVDYVLSTPTEETITLPNIPTIDGNNTLNIETEITPSQVYIKYKSNT